MCEDDGGPARELYMDWFEKFLRARFLYQLFRVDPRPLKWAGDLHGIADSF